MIRAALAAALALAPLPALAATLGTIQVGQAGVRTSFATPGSATYRVRLQGGLDYALETAANPGGGYVQALDAGGRVLAQAGFNSLDQLGATFRVRASGDYFVKVVDQSASPAYAPDDVWTAVDTDCAAAARTLCTLPVGATRTGKLFNYKGDVDWYSTALRRGVTYSVHLEITDGPPVALRVRDAGGRTLTAWATGIGAADLAFRAPATAAYFVEATFDQDEAAARYAISLSVR